MKYKYTSDGKKVVVVGQLNAQETIVQEVFVSGDVEVASGENFVVKSLHDQPVESWKEKRLRELEATYEADRNKYTSLIDGARKSYHRENETIKALINNAIGIKNTLKNHAKFNKGALNDLFMFLSGEVKFLVKHDWRYVIEPFEDQIREGEYDKIKLISLFGKSNGDLSWRLHRWSDGSGDNYQNIIPCQSMEEAKAILENAINKEKKISSPMIEAKKKYGLSVPTKEQETEFNNSRIQDIEKSIKKLSMDIEKKRSEITKIGR